MERQLSPVQDLTVFGSFVSVSRCHRYPTFLSTQNSVQRIKSIFFCGMQCSDLWLLPVMLLMRLLDTCWLSRWREWEWIHLSCCYWLRTVRVELRHSSHGSFTFSPTKVLIHFLVRCICLPLTPLRRISDAVDKHCVFTTKLTMMYVFTVKCV